MISDYICIAIVLRENIYSFKIAWLLKNLILNSYVTNVYQ